MFRMTRLIGFLLMLCAAPAFAETIELVTYYPSSVTTGQVDTNRLRAGRGTVGDLYSITTPADAVLTDGILLVADGLGVGSVFGTTPPIGSLHVVGPNNQADTVLFLPGTGGTLSVGIGTPAPATPLEVVSTSANQTRGILSSQYSTDTNAASFIGRKAGGTRTAPTVVSNGDNLAGLIAEGYDGAAYQQPGRLGYVVSGAVTGGSVPSDFVLRTGASNQGVERLRVTSAGNVGIGTAAPRIPAPNGQAGNLDANDIFLRGVNRWLSQEQPPPTSTSSILAANMTYSGLTNTVLLSVTVTATGRPILIQAKVLLQPPVGMTQTDLFLLRSGTAQRLDRAQQWINSTVGNASVTLGLFAIDTPPVGTYTYQLAAQCDAGTTWTALAADNVTKLVVTQYR